MRLVQDVPESWYSTPEWGEHNVKPEFEYEPIVDGRVTSFWPVQHKFTGPMRNPEGDPDKRYTQDVLLATFDSREQYVAYLRETPIPQISREYGSTSSEEPCTHGFYGGVSWEEALEMLEYGWQGKEAEKLAAMSLQAGLDCPPLDFRPKATPCEEGSELSIERHLSGMDEQFSAMLRTGQETSKQRHGTAVKITVNSGATAGVSAKQMFHSGMVVAAAVVAIERAGMSVEVDTIAVVHIRGGLCGVRVPVKHAGEPIDYGVLAFALGHPAYHRRLKFGWIERCPPSVMKAHGGYGSSTYLNENVTRNFGCEELGLVVTLEALRHAPPMTVLAQLIARITGSEEEAA